MGDAVSTKKSVVGPAVGGVIGGLALLGVVVLGAFFWKRRIKHQFPSHDKVEMQGDVLERPMTVPYNYNPYEQQQGPESAPLRQVQPSQSSVVLPTVATQGGVLASSKAREAAGYLSHRTLPSTVSSSGPSSSGPASSREPPTEASGPTVAHISPTEVQGLRAEVENLRRAMEEIQAERMEAPPGYHDSQAQNSNPTQVFIPSVSQYSPPPTTPYP